MQQAKQIGKVVISLPPHRDETVTIRPDGAYLITGGLGALGLQVAQQLVGEGAKHLVLTGRRGVTTAEQRRRCRQLAAAGATVQSSPPIWQMRADVQRLLDRCAAIAPLLRHYPRRGGAGRWRA